MDRGRVIACDTLPHLLRLEEGSVRFRVASLTPELRRGLEAHKCDLVMVNLAIGS